MPTLTWEERLYLAQRFAPRLVGFPEKQGLGKPKITGGAGDYQPRAIDLLLDRGRLYPGTLRSIARLHFAHLFSHTSRPPATLDNLANSQHSFDQIRLLGPAVPNPDRAWTNYFEILNGKADRFPVTTYAHVVTRDEALEANQSDQHATLVGQPFYRATTARADDVVLQYWFCYYFDDWANIHEGDWEGIAIFLHKHGADWTPLGATYYAHENGARRHWKDIEVFDGTHPLVYVASGSHASYFQHTPDGHATQLSGYILAQLKLKVSFRVNTGNRDFVPQRGADQDLLVPRVEVLPDPIGPRDQTDPAWQHLKWLNYPGSWGARELGRFIAGGPTGPSHKGLKWSNPFAWSEAECWPDYLIY
jgi:hypothetical protein